MSNSFDGLVQMIEKDYGENGTEENLKAILESIKDNYEKTIITTDKTINNDYNGIKVVNIIDFLLEDV